MDTANVFLGTQNECHAHTGLYIVVESPPVRCTQMSRVPAFKPPLLDSMESVRHSQQVHVYQFCVSNFSRCGDQRQYGLGHDSDYPLTEIHPGGTFAVVPDDSSTTFSTTGARGQDSSPNTTVAQSLEAGIDSWLDLPDLPTLDDGHYQTFIEGGTTSLYANNPIQLDDT